MQVKSSKSTAICIVPWYPFPLHNGGALRAFHVISQVGLSYQTTAILPSNSSQKTEPIELEFRKRESDVNVLHAVASPQRSLLRRIQDRISTMLASGSISQRSNLVSLSLLNKMDQSLRKMDPSIIVLSEIDSLLLVPRIRKLRPSTPICLDMHNVNHILARQCIKETGDHRSRIQYKRLLEVESNLSRKVDFIFACSENDLNIFRDLNGSAFKGAVIPNGVDTRSAAFDSNPKKHQIRNIIYCASLTTKANIDGIIWFADNIWPLVHKTLPDLKLTVIGSGSDNPEITPLKANSSITFAGRVDELSDYYRNASISICPLRIGSGTRLKILEAMSYGNPVVSTSLGCEGLKVVDDETLIIRDSPEEFASGVVTLLTNPSDFHRIREKARQFAEDNFDWNVIGLRMLDAFASLK